MKLTKIYQELKIKPEEDIILTNIKEAFIEELGGIGGEEMNKISQIKDAQTIMEIMEILEWDEYESKAFAYEIIIQTILNTIGKNKLWTYK